MEKSKTPTAKSTVAKQRIGDALIDDQLINQQQLRLALAKQAQSGEHLGSILIGMGFISIDNLLDFLTTRSGLPAVNLYDITIDKALLDQIPREKIFNLKILPIDSDEKSLTLAMVNPQDFETISEIGFLVGKKIKVTIVPSFMMEAARKILLTDPSGGLDGELIQKMVAAAGKKITDKPPLITLLQYLAKSNANDMLFSPGAPPSLKISNEVRRLSMSPLTPEDCELFAKELLSDDEWKQFSESNDFGIAITYPSIGRFRANIFRQRNSIAIAIRNLPETIPSFSQLNLPSWLREFALKPQGLILVGGPAGHGKSTTLCAMVDVINTNRRCNIVTLEDPVEYLHQHKMCNINQRQIGRDTKSFHEGLRNVFRQAPDVIVIGEMRDKASYEIALKAASTGHLVLSTIHANNATSVIETVINTFEPHEQTLIRYMLADCLLLCIAQRLVSRKDGSGRVLALERLINSHRTRKRIREEKTHHIRSQMQAGTEDYTSLDISLAYLFKKGLIRMEDGLQYVEDENFFKEVIASKV